MLSIRGLLAVEILEEASDVIGSITSGTFRVKAKLKLHYASWFGAGSEPVRSWFGACSEPAPNQLV